MQEEVSRDTCLLTLTGRTWKISSFLRHARSASRGREREPHIACRSNTRQFSILYVTRKFIQLSHSGDGCVACRGGSTEVASSRAFGDLFEPFYLVRHRFLEKWPHLEPEAKDEGF